jgi:hypothetical protein
MLFWYPSHGPCTDDFLLFVLTLSLQLQCTAIGFVFVENRGFSIKWCGGLFYMDLCVLVFQILVCWCVFVSLDLFWYCSHEILKNEFTGDFEKRVHTNPHKIYLQTT